VYYATVRSRRVRRAAPSVCKSNATGSNPVESISFFSGNYCVLRDRQVASGSKGSALGLQKCLLAVSCGQNEITCSSEVSRLSH